MLSTPRTISFSVKNSSFSTIANVWAYLMVETLCQFGVRAFFIAPGSRSTPLVTEVASRCDVVIMTHFDERSLGFMALGYAKQSGHIPCVITTSGTAVANLLPSMVEATLSEIPIIALTADRPTHLIGVGANQAINQRNIFGDYAATCLDLGDPGESTSPENVIYSIMRCLEILLQTKCPVHINARFDVPFTPTADVRSFSHYLRTLHDYRYSINMAVYSASQIESDEYKKSIKIINNSRCPLLLISEGDDYLHSFCLEISERFSVLVMTDGTSKLHYADFSTHLRFGDRLISVPGALDGVDCIIWVGDHLVSTRFLDWLSDTTIPIVHLSGLVNCPNPLLKPVCSVFTSQTILTRFSCEVSIQSDANVSSRLLSYDRVLAERFSDYLANATVLSEWQVAHLVTRYSERLFCANSLSIRTCHVAGAQGGVRALYLNRGASGIDGLISTAIGIGFANSDMSGLTVLIGDMSCLYDLNAFLALKQCRTPIRIVLLNNNGGGVFSFLPVNDGSKLFERYFQMPTECEFSSFGVFAGLNYILVKTLPELESCLKSPIKHHELIEVAIPISISENQLSQLESLLRYPLAKDS